MEKSLLYSSIGGVLGYLSAKKSKKVSRSLLGSILGFGLGFGIERGLFKSGKNALPVAIKREEIAKAVAAARSLQNEEQNQEIQNGALPNGNVLAVGAIPINLQNITAENYRSADQIPVKIGPIVVNQNRERYWRTALWVKYMNGRTALNVLVYEHHFKNKTKFDPYGLGMYGTEV